MLTKSKTGFKGKKQVARPRLVTSQASIFRARNAESTNSDYRLHIVMDKESVIKLRALKAQLEASTEAEVIRRALKAYEVFEPADTLEGDSGHDTQSLTSDDVEHLYIRIPTRVKERLDAEQKRTGRTYGIQVRQALRVLTQLTREVEVWKLSQADKQKGDTDEKQLNLHSLLLAVAS